MTVAARDIDDLDLERIAARGWQAEHVDWLGEWLLRANDGFTGRANSVLPLGDPGMALDAALAEVTAWYARHGLPPWFSVPSPARDDLGAALTARGWTAAPVVARLMVADLADLAPPDDAAPGPPVEVRPVPSLEWQAVYRGGGLPTAGRRLLVRADVVGFAHVLEGHDVVAVGRGTVADGWLGITAVEVVPRARRRGLATRVLGALVGWGRARGADHAYLQVGADNQSAARMYERAGFTTHHTYRLAVPLA